MARAGWCAGCSRNVWLAADGSCPAGHPASAVSGVYDVVEPAPQIPVPAAPAPGQPAAWGPPMPPAAPPRRRVWPILIAIMLIITFACCAVAALVLVARSDKQVEKSESSVLEGPAAAEVSGESSRKGPESAKELADYLKAEYGSEPWYPAIAEVRYVTRLGYPVCQVVIADGGDRRFDPTHEKDSAILEAIDAAEITFANNIETIGVKGVRSSMTQEPWKGLERPKPLAELDPPADLPGLESWIEAQWGPDGANPVDEAWYEVFETAQWSVSANRITVRTSLPRTPDGGMAEEDLMYAVGQAGLTFADSLAIVYADGASDTDGVKYEIPWK